MTHTDICRGMVQRRLRHRAELHTLAFAMAVAGFAIICLMIA